MCWLAWKLIRYHNEIHSWRIECDPGNLKVGLDTIIMYHWHKEIHSWRIEWDPRNIANFKLTIIPSMEVNAPSMSSPSGDYLLYYTYCIYRYLGRRNTLHPPLFRRLPVLFLSLLVCFFSTLLDRITAERIVSLYGQNYPLESVLHRSREFCCIIQPEVGWVAVLLDPFA